jgi:hypothetical protein
MKVWVVKRLYGKESFYMPNSFILYDYCFLGCDVYYQCLEGA